MGNAYSAAGVNVEAGYETVERIKKHAKRTERLGVMGALGGFGGAFDLSSLNVKEPVLVSGTDGVGTKLMLAIGQDKHETIGIDCVAMCVNDILAQGAEPLYFLDYIATGKTVPEKMEQIVAGISEGCVQAGAALIGGETAEMPDMYEENDYDVAGFCVGVVEKSQLLTPEQVKAGDSLIGLASSGIHSNGYSLVRKICFEQNTFSFEDTFEELDGKRLGDLLLEPTKIYVQTVLPLLKKGWINGLSHITGGGFIENLPRMLPEGLCAEVNVESFDTPAIFGFLEHHGQLNRKEMYGIFNMGIGMVLAVPAEKEAEVMATLTEAGDSAFVIGEVTENKEEAVRLA
ncbi:Phosphoribosylformylglycinamidine cyclo-ligase [Alkalibacterium sp. AK22]|uniref:phosphoribosylformylglycinamidine cyclo-ligase n=1 Tax=Alkalibacterium sp. AK22 TaxID=1229520 RepID=UPI00044A5A21|nr:phosphoribosylformylglycinamidine cyclo-ligase [Alkalibacterium sp. AK22]EXJ23976.1 Phosphoribosylformylglycinamidine cyclo-ligase [Alkalibacterium sp. AK22]